MRAMLSWQQMTFIDYQPGFPFDEMHVEMLNYIEGKLFKLYLLRSKTYVSCSHNYSRDERGEYSAVEQTFYV